MMKACKSALSAAGFWLFAFIVSKAVSETVGSDLPFEDPMEKNKEISNPHSYSPLLFKSSGGNADACMQHPVMELFMRPVHVIVILCEQDRFIKTPDRFMDFLRGDNTAPDAVRVNELHHPKPSVKDAVIGSINGVSSA